MSYITAELMGGLGNQMFQISHALSVAKELGVQAKFSRQGYTPMQALQPSEYEKNIYYNLLFDNDIKPSVFIGENDLQFCDLHKIKEFLEIGPVSFKGYFQSDSYFKNIIERLPSVFCLDFVDFLNLIESKNIFEKNSVSIHIRRGDYLTIPSILPSIDISYFEKALALIGYYQKIYIFTDDKEYAKNLPFQNFEVVEGYKDYEEMLLMSLCETNIISNSSFSWWGSFLNSSENKTVYAPSQWLGPDAEKFPKSIYREDMRIVDVVYKNGVLYA